jgi:aminopeptidase 2
MVSHSDTVNISNMPAASETVYDPSSKVDAELSNRLSTLSKDIQWKITKFQTSPPMSTYLVAFANGPFSYLEKSVVMPLSGRIIPLRVYGEHSCSIRTKPSSDHAPTATPDIIHQTQFCLDVGAQVLPLYETIFDIEYPLPKLDTLAVSCVCILLLGNVAELVISQANDFDMG